MIRKNNGKQRLNELTNAFYNAPQGIEVNNDKVTVSNYSTPANVDFMETNEIRRVEKILSNEVPIETLIVKSSEIRHNVVKKAMGVTTTLNVAQIFEIITDIIGLDQKDYTTFFNGLEPESKDFFINGLKKLSLGKKVNDMLENEPNNTQLA